jgi:hypothetical protein
MRVQRAKYAVRTGGDGIAAGRGISENKEKQA